MMMVGDHNPLHLGTAERWSTTWKPTKPLPAKAMACVLMYTIPFVARCREARARALTLQAGRDAAEAEQQVRHGGCCIATRTFVGLTLAGAIATKDFIAIAMSQAPACDSFGRRRTTVRVGRGR